MTIETVGANMPVPTKETKTECLGMSQAEVMLMLDYAKFGVEFSVHSLGFQMTLPDDSTQKALTLKELLNALNAQEAKRRDMLTDNVCLIAGRRRPISHLLADLNSMGNDPYQLIADILVTAGVFNVKTSDA